MAEINDISSPLCSFLFQNQPEYKCKSDNNCKRPVPTTGGGKQMSPPWWEQWLEFAILVSKQVQSLFKTRCRGNTHLVLNWIMLLATRLGLKTTGQCLFWWGKMPPSCRHLRICFNRQGRENPSQGHQKPWSGHAWPSIGLTFSHTCGRLKC